MMANANEESSRARNPNDNSTYILCVQYIHLEIEDNYKLYVQAFVVNK